MQKKKHKKTKKIYLLYICIILILIYCIIQIYAVFQSEVSGSVNIKNGVWQIKINNTDISRGTDKQFVVDEIEVQNNEHVKPGNLAPGLSGTFDILIDPTNTDVSIKYDISLNQENLTNKNISIKSIKEANKGAELVRTGENTFTGIITLDEIKKRITNNIEVEVEWKDNEETNKEDIEIGSKSEDYKLDIPIIVHVSQYLGEEIVAYDEQN